MSDLGTLVDRLAAKLRVTWPECDVKVEPIGCLRYEPVERHAWRATATNTAGDLVFRSYAEGRSSVIALEHLMKGCA